MNISHCREITPHDTLIQTNLHDILTACIDNKGKRQGAHFEYFTKNRT